MGNASLATMDMESDYGRTTQQIDGVLTLTKKSSSIEDTKPWRRLRWHSSRSSNSYNNHVKSLLMRSILARDWQTVLIRARLFPSEVNQFSVLEVPLFIPCENKKVSNRPRYTTPTASGIGNRGKTTENDEAGGQRVRIFRVRVLPIHAACAVHPPPEVVRAVLSRDVKSVIGQGGFQNHGRGRKRQQISLPVSSYHKHGTSLASVAVERPKDTNVGRSVVNKLRRLGSMARKVSGYETGDCNLRLLDFETEEEACNDSGVGGDDSELVEWTSNSRKSADHRENEKDVTLFLKQMEDYLTHNGRCKKWKHQTSPLSAQYNSSRCHRFVLDFDPSVLLPSPSSVKANEKQTRGLRGHRSGTCDPWNTDGDFHDHELISLENSIGDMDTAMTTSTSRLVGNVGNLRDYKDDEKSSSLEYLTDSSSSSNSSASSSTLQPPPRNWDNSDESNNSDNNSFLQLTADGGLSLIDLEDDTYSSSILNASNETSFNDEAPLVSNCTSDFLATNGSGTNSRRAKGTSSDSRVTNSQQKFVPEDIRLNALALLKSLPQASRRKQGHGKTEVAKDKRDGKQALQQEMDLVHVSQLLPLHIACLYGASGSAIKVLLQEYPEGSSIEVFGMLPVHMVAANWSLEAKLDLSWTNGVNDDDENSDCCDTKQLSGLERDRLAALVEDLPRNLWATSSAHGLRPLEYIRILLCYPSNTSDERIKCARNYLDSIEKSHILGSIENSSRRSIDNIRYSKSIEPSFTCTTSGSTFEHEVSSSSWMSNDSSSMRDSTVPLSDLLSEGRWEEAVSLLERNPAIAKECFFGGSGCDKSSNDVLGNGCHSRYHKGGSISSYRDRKGPLPIHLVCQILRNGSTVPLSLIRLLVSSYPDGLKQVDHPSTGSLPLHLICDSFCRRNKTSGIGRTTGEGHRRFIGERLAVLQLILRTYPLGTRALDCHGRLPLHRSVLVGAPFEAIRMLVYRDPKAIALPDRDGATPFSLAKKLYSVDSGVVKLLELAWV